MSDCSWTARSEREKSWQRKIRLENATVWHHHRGGWTYVIEKIRENFCCSDGMVLVSSVEDGVNDDTMPDEPWIGFVHQVPVNNYPYFPDLARLVKNDVFLKSLEQCRGIFTLSSLVKEYIKLSLPNVPVCNVLYPATPTTNLFDPEKWSKSNEKSIVFIGEYMRNFQYFFDLKVPKDVKKVLVLSPDVSLEKLRVTRNDSVEIVEYLDVENYDKILTSNIVFLNLFDAPANTTVVECITRNTPLLVNRLPGLEEYLGIQYPLFYTSEFEALEMIRSEKKIMEGYEYLKSLSIKNQLTMDSFLSNIETSAIYRSLPVPETQRDASMTEYDLSVVVCSYKRVYNMRRLLQSFVDQTTVKKFELFIWNNNFDARNELQQICDEFATQLSLKVIHSTENFFCIIRMAVSSLIKSDLLMICDDDVVPTPSFLNGYLSKFEEYGPDVVLCCRGHKWRQHVLNEEHPELCWTEYENLRFYSESHEDTEVHFLHADSCLIPKRLMMAALQYPLPDYGIILVDDYWLSFVFSHYLRIPIWKIRGDNLFETTPCSEDPDIALYLNERVRSERIRMYIYHMRKGWPNSILDKKIN